MILMFSLHLLNVANISTQQTPFSWLRAIPICFSAYHPSNIPISANSHFCAKNLQAFFSPDSHFYEFPFYRERTVSELMIVKLSDIRYLKFEKTLLPECPWTTPPYGKPPQRPHLDDFG